MSSHSQGRSWDILCQNRYHDVIPIGFYSLTVQSISLVLIIELNIEHQNPETNFGFGTIMYQFR